MTEEAGGPEMTDDHDAKPEGPPEDQPADAEPPPRRVPRKRDDSEKGLGLEMARLFGMNPKTLMAPKPPPENPREAADDEDSEPRD
jgi:hypothetical protein